MWNAISFVRIWIRITMSFHTTITITPPPPLKRLLDVQYVLVWFLCLMAYQLLLGYLEEQWWYYLTHSWEDKRVHTFPKGICPKVNVIARLEYELAYYDSAVHRFNHYTTRTPPSICIAQPLMLHAERRVLLSFIYVISQNVFGCDISSY